MGKAIEFYIHEVGADEIASLQQTLASRFITLGPRVAELEQAFGDHLGVEQVVGVSSCSIGLILTLRVHGIGPGDEVITTPMTFVATSNAVLHTGAKPVFAEIDPRSGLIDPAAVEAAITSRTRAIIAVHLYGQLAEMARLRAIADRHQLLLIEDAAHATCARRDGIRVAELGDATVFSFYATKEMTCGDGGAIALHDPQLADRLRRLRNHGQTTDAFNRHGSSYRHWDMTMLGYKAAMTDIDAALLLPQVPRLERRRELREAAVLDYETRLGGQHGITLVEHRGTSSHHLFPVLVGERVRDEVLAGLGRRSVGCAVNYRSVLLLSYYREVLGLSPDALPRALEFGNRVLSLPLWPGISSDDIAQASRALVESVAEVSGP
jgi:UDP-4-amino-4-deoxy-L-arabinose-oxoglutarate aminotransferase